MNRTRKIETTFEVIRVVVSMAIAYVAALIILSVISEDPLYIIQQFVLGPFSSLRRIGSIVNLAIPFTFCGLGMCFMYAVDKFNLVGEGVFLLSGCVITWVAIAMEGLGLPTPVMLVLLFAIGALVGVAMAAIPAVLELKFSANVVVVSLMLNYVMTEFSQYILKYFMKDSSMGFLASYAIPSNATMTKFLGDFKIQSALLLAIACVIVVVMIFYKTPFGYTMRTVGNNKHFAKTAGMGVASTILIAQLFGGAFAGIGGTAEILGNYTRFQWTATTGHGFDGLMVAVLAKRNPALIPVGALLLSYIRIGADVVNTSGDIPKEFITVIQGIIILLVAAEMFLSGFKNKMIFKSAKMELAKKQAEEKTA